jgi:hypothetical protein
VEQAPRAAAAAAAVSCMQQQQQQQQLQKTAHVPHEFAKIFPNSQHPFD